MSLKYAALVAAMCLFTPAAGETAENTSKVELTPFAAYRFGGTFDVTDTDTSYKMEDSPSYGLLINIRQQPNTQWEILYAQQQSDASFSDTSAGISRVDVNLQTLQGGGTYQWEGDTIRPYLAMTLGGTKIKTTATGASQSDTFWSGSIGGGLQIMPNDHFGIRLEIRAYGTLMDSNTDIFCRTGPNQNVCAVRLDGTLLTQVETLAGIVLRF